MDATAKQPSSSLAHAWLALIALTLVGLALGERFHGMAWLQLLVAAIIWLKGMLVARQFIEVGLAHPFIRRVLFAFIAFTPLALIAVTYFGAQVVHWASL